MIFCFKSDILKYHLLLISPILAYFTHVTLWFLFVYIVLFYIYTLYYF